VQQKLDLIILNCYADDEEKNSFYDTLEATFDLLPKNCIRLIVGNLNAQIGNIIWTNDCKRKLASYHKWQWSQNS
jgi:hypothetical protein